MPRCDTSADDLTDRMPKRRSVAAIRAQLQVTPYEELPATLSHLVGDERAQVAELVAHAYKRYEKETAERARVEVMYALMYELGEGAETIVGLDEVGRGPIAGPLTVAAVVLPEQPRIWGINDSKKLTPKKREELAAEILEHACAVGIAHIQPAEIDACGMAASLRVAMRRAIEDTGVDPSCVLIDGVPLNIHPAETAVVHGDARVACIAAASIVAKVTRDAIMVAADELYPGYHFAASKGYASAEHIAAIRELGLSPFHRASFCQNILNDQAGPQPTSPITS